MGRFTGSKPRSTASSTWRVASYLYANLRPHPASPQRRSQRISSKAAAAAAAAAPADKQAALDRELELQSELRALALGLRPNGTRADNLLQAVGPADLMLMLYCLVALGVVTEAEVAAACDLQPATLAAAAASAAQGEGSVPGAAQLTPEQRTKVQQLLAKFAAPAREPSYTRTLPDPEQLPQPLPTPVAAIVAPGQPLAAALAPQAANGASTSGTAAQAASAQVTPAEVVALLPGAAPPQAAQVATSTAAAAVSAAAASATGPLASSNAAGNAAAAATSAGAAAAGASQASPASAAAAAQSNGHLDIPSSSGAGAQPPQQPLPTVLPTIVAATAQSAQQQLLQLLPAPPSGPPPKRPVLRDHDIAVDPLLACFQESVHPLVSMALEQALPKHIMDPLTGEQGSWGLRLPGPNPDVTAALPNLSDAPVHAVDAFVFSLS